MTRADQERIAKAMGDATPESWGGDRCFMFPASDSCCWWGPVLEWLIAEHHTYLMPLVTVTIPPKSEGEEGIHIRNPVLHEAINAAALAVCPEDE